MDRSMENGFHSPRTESFPVGLRVLVVDDDPTWLKILEKMLKRCSYEVTTCSLARVALDKLRERKDGFDIVISDVNMPDMDGFKLLEHVGLEMDLPVIMMSVDGETSRVMKGVQHGACDYLLKPVRMKELKNIWQHVLRKKIHEVKDIESYDGNEEMLFRHGLDNGGSFLIGGDVSSGKKRKETDNREHDDQEFSDLSSMKKARVVWSVDLHQKFVDAVNQIGLVIGPKKILDLMNVPWLTRENVASHLQKYRLYLSRLQKPSDPKISFCGIKQQDLSPRDPNTNNSKQSQQSQQSQCPIPVHQNSAATCGFGYTGTSSHVQDAGSEIHEGDLKGIISFLPVTEPKKSSKSDLPASQKKNGPQMSFTDSFGSSALDVSNVSFEANRSKQSWSREVPILQLKQQPKQEQEQFGYTNLPLPGQQHKVQAESLEPGPSINLGQSISGPSFEMKPFCSEYEFSTYNNISPVGDILGPIQAEAPEIINPQEFGALSTINGLPSIKHHDFNQHCSSIWESNQQNLIPDGSTLFLSPEELQPNFLQDYAFIEDVGLNNNEILNYHDPVLFSDVPAHSYDRLRFNNDYLFESTLEYPIIDQGLFIA